VEPSEPLRGQIQSFLEPGEAIACVVPCGTGRPDSLGSMLSHDELYTINRLIVVSDRWVVLFKTKSDTFVPTSLVSRLPLGTPIGPLEGRTRRTFELNGTRYYVRWRFRRDVEMADIARRG
jgi:hypothetical protein